MENSYLMLQAKDSMFLSLYIKLLTDILNWPGKIIGNMSHGATVFLGIGLFPGSIQNVVVTYKV